MEKEKTKVEDFEASLVKEEKVLESIRDSLKGETSPQSIVRDLIQALHR
jgi:hypothetical protein